MWARIDNGYLAEFISFEPTGRFHPSIEWVEVPEELRPWVDSSWATTEAGDLEPPSLDALRTQMFERLAAKRWAIETGGTALPDGTQIPTDERTRNVIMAAYVKAKADPAYAIPNWKFGAGQFGPLDAATIIAIGDAIEAHVQAAFGREAEITAALEAKRAVGTLIEMWDAEIDQGWPA
ncbi:MAG: DUF4376 domain-containing protein [Pseudomonadota bacterium]|nr:DUF4376 domain-containing protein [Pseudomonadota bacterium]